jgi:two-component system, OmpR family, phosphate regulon sensor histidine kinase PhoR
MNRVRFTGLIVMMALSVIGIICVQTIWIKNAIGIRNENFNNAVFLSLNDAANSIESSRRMNFLNDFFMGNSLPADSVQDEINRFMSFGSYSPSPGGSLHVRITNQSLSQNRDSGRLSVQGRSYIFSGDTSVTSDSASYIVSLPGGSGKMNASKRGADDNGNGGPGYINQNDLIERVRKKSTELSDMSNKMIADIYQWEKTLDIDKKEIEGAVRRSLTFVGGIQTPFEFAIIRNGEVQDGTFRKSQQKDFLKSNYMVRLFPDNIFRQDLILSVIFPERTNYVLGSMAFILGGSMLFSLFIVSTFALSLFFIIRQKKISEMKSDFINNMTHEFKTPIATISLAADTITNPRVIGNEERVRHFIGMIKKENSRMNKKVETILQIASLDKKEIEFRFEATSVHTIIEHAVEMIDIQVQQRNGKINLNLDAEEPMIYGDSDHLLNLVSNLLDNAIKYSNGSPEITVSTKNNGRGVIFSVEDRGIGMTKAVQSKIFERFYRLNSGNVHDVKGFGLGLNYVRAIIEAHKGMIDVVSEPGKGSRFDIFLPFNYDN